MPINKNIISQGKTKCSLPGLEIDYPPLFAFSAIMKNVFRDIPNVQAKVFIAFHIKNICFSLV